MAPQDLPLLAPRRRLRGYVATPPSVLEVSSSLSNLCGRQKDYRQSDDPNAIRIDKERGSTKVASWLQPVQGAEDWAAEGSAQAQARSCKERGFQGITFFWGGVLRVDVLEVRGNCVGSRCCNLCWPL